MKTAIIFMLSIFMLSGCANLQAGADGGAWVLCNYPYPYIYGGEDESNLCARLYRQFNNLSDEEATQIYNRFNGIVEKDEEYTNEHI